MTLRTRLAEALGGKDLRAEQDKLKAGMAALWGAYLDGPYELPPEELLRQLHEYDSAILQDLVTQLEWEKVGAVSTYGQDTDAERIRVMNECRRLWRYDPLASWIINTWTNFGFGQNVIITPNDEAAAETWQEFWTADRNEPILAADNQHEMSDTVLVDGETFLAFYVSKLDGKVTVRTFDSSEVSEVITAPNDKRVPLFYKRQWTETNGRTQEAYYPDASALMSADDYSDEMDEIIKTARITRADEMDDSTSVCVLHISHNRKSGNRGWPIMSSGTAWARAHKQFRENRVAVAAAVAMYVNKLKVQGGSRAVESVRAKLQSALSSTNYSDTNPAAAPGSTWLENQSADLTRLPLGSGAGDAKTDGEALLQMVGLSGGLFPHWLGVGTYRLASATSMDQPQYRNFDRYQQFWSAQFKRMVRIVLWASNEWGGTNYTDFGAEVNIDTLLETDIPALTGNVTTYMAQVSAMVSANLMPTPEAKRTVNYLNRMLLEAYGDEDVNEIAPEDEAYFNAEPAPAQTTPATAGETAPPPNAKALKRIAALRERVLKLAE